MQRSIPWPRSKARSPLLQVLKTSVAAITAWLSCEFLLGQPMPIFATIAALLVVQPSVNQSLAKGIERSVGVILGVLLAFGASALFGDATWVALGVVLVALVVAWALKLTPGSANQIPISAMLVVALGGGAAGYAGERVIETVVGAMVGLAVNVLIVPPVLVGPAEASIRGLAGGIAASLDELAATLTRERDAGQVRSMLKSARELRRLQGEATAAVDAAQDSLMLNPLGRRHWEVLDGHRDFLGRLTVLVTRVIGMARAVQDNYDPQLVDDPVAASIAVELGRAAQDVHRLARRLGHPGQDDDAQPMTAELPALTAPLVIAKPHPDHWILVGSLMEDLRRIREVIIGSAD